MLRLYLKQITNKMQKPISPVSWTVSKLMKLRCNLSKLSDEEKRLLKESRPTPDISIIQECNSKGLKFIFVFKSIIWVHNNSNIDDLKSKKVIQECNSNGSMLSLFLNFVLYFYYSKCLYTKTGYSFYFIFCFTKLFKTVLVSLSSGKS